MEKLSWIFIVFFVLSMPGKAYTEEGIVAKVNGVNITASDLEIEVDRLIPRATYHRNVSEERRADFRKKALDNLIEQELQYQDAVARGMKPDKKQVKERMKQIRDRFSSRKEYKAALEQAGISEDGLRKRVEREVLIQAVIDETVTKPADVSEKELRDYYSANLDKFRQPESVRLRVISVKDEKKAREIHGRLMAGEDFGALAATMSEDMYRIKGGDIGYIHRGRMIQEVEKTAFSLKIGEVSRPVKAGGMWYIVRCEDRLPEKQLTFDEVKARLERDLEAKKRTELMERWISDLASKAKIERFLN